MTDTINSPPHYNFGKLEVIEVIEDWQLDFHLGNAVKYIARAKHKGHELEDLHKAKWYIERAISNLEQATHRAALQRAEEARRSVGEGWTKEEIADEVAPWPKKGTSEAT